MQNYGYISLTVFPQFSIVAIDGEKHINNNPRKTFPTRFITFAFSVSMFVCFQDWLLHFSLSLLESFPPQILRFSTNLVVMEMQPMPSNGKTIM